MYADDSIVYTSETTANEVTETLNKESVLEWVASNKLVLNISKTKHCICYKSFPKFWTSAESGNKWCGC
jgi:hypothetical protein